MTPAEVQKALRERRKSQNKCTICGKTARPGKNTCLECQKKRSKSTLKYRENNRKKFNETVTNRYQNKKLIKTCVRCLNPADPGITFCKSCRSERNIISKRSYDSKIDNQLCVNCRSKSINGVLCDVCVEKRHQYNSKPEIQIKFRKYREESWQKVLLSTLKARAKKKNIIIDPNLAWNDIPDPTGQKCPVFSQEFIMGIGKKENFSATVDRIRPELGYVPGNLQLLSSLANAIKSNADASIIERVGKAVLLKENNDSEPIHDMNEVTRQIRQKMITQKRAFNKHDLEFSINWYDISLPDKCPCTGIKINYESKENWKTRPSIDRIDNSKGYVPGNVWVISAWANAIKSNANGKQILQVAAFQANSSFSK